MSNVAAELIETWLKENPVTEVSNSQTSSQPETIAKLVQQNYFALMNAGKISPSRLKELAFAQKPTTAELVIIANNLDIPEELVVELRDRTFPKSQSKPKQTNGHT